MFKPTMQQRTKLVNILVSAREDAGLTQEQLSKKMGASKTFANKVERMTREIGFFEIVAWAKAAGKDPIELMRQVV